MHPMSEGRESIFALRGERISVRQKSVLIVDDGPLIRQKLCEMLIREGDFDICGEAENGRKAIEKARQLHPDLIIMDLSMPEMNGLEAVRALKESIPSTPIIMFSNYVDPFVEKLALSIGVVALVSKSENISALLKAARGLFVQRAA
jgi:DNA-binding NarL/FixJ family response regulator